MLVKIRPRLVVVEGLHATTNMWVKDGTKIPILIAFCIGFKISSIITDNFNVRDGLIQKSMTGLQESRQINKSLSCEEALDENLLRRKENFVSSKFHLSSMDSCLGVPFTETVYDQKFKLKLPESEPLYSSVRVSSLYGMNFATGRNICVKPDNSKIFFVYADNIPAMVFKRRSGFNWGWQFEVVKGKIPPKSTRVYGTTIIVSPAYTKHVTHFAESSIPIWHALSQPNKYPVHSGGDRIFLKQSNFKDELEWNQKILSFLAHHTRNATIIDSSSFRSSSLICFEKAGMIGMGLHEFGFFANEAEANTFRCRILLYYRIPVVIQSSLLQKSR